MACHAGIQSIDIFGNGSGTFALTQWVKSEGLGERVGQGPCRHVQHEDLLRKQRGQSPPGDPKASAWNVCNCRCSTYPVVPEG